MKFLVLAAICIAAVGAQQGARVVPFTVVYEDRSTVQSNAVTDLYYNYTAYKFPNERVCLIHKGVPTANDTGKYRNYDVPEVSPPVYSQQVGPAITSFCQGSEVTLLGEGTTIEPQSRYYSRRMGRCGYYYGGSSYYPYYYGYPVYYPYPVYVPVPVPAPPPPPPPPPPPAK